MAVDSKTRSVLDAVKLATSPEFVIVRKDGLYKQ